MDELTYNWLAGAGHGLLKAIEDRYAILLFAEREGVEPPPVRPSLEKPVETTVIELAVIGYVRQAAEEILDALDKQLRKHA